MSTIRFSCLAGSLLILASAVPAWSQESEFRPPYGPSSRSASAQTSEDCCACEAVAASPIRKTYSLAEMGDDASFGAWIAEMIPQVVQPGTWNTGDAKSKHVLSYYAPAKMLLVYHTPAVHAEIDDFLRGMKKSMPTTKATAKAPALFGLTQMKYTVADSQAEPAPVALGYPVAAPTQQPRHLFHFIIRYEGDGIIDRNVAEFAKAYGNAAAASATEAAKAMPEAVKATPAESTKSETPAKPVTPACCAMPGCCTAPAACPPPATVGTTPAPAPLFRPAAAPAPMDEDKE
jgi:hypothetical protein